MYKKQEASALKEQFWTNFGRYMAPIPAADGEKLNWINYKTGVKGLQFVMAADTATATISIVVQSPDHERQQLLFNRLVALREALHDALCEVWHWEQQGRAGDGKPCSRIYNELKGVNIFSSSDWPAIISFFKPRMIALDKFWSNNKAWLEAL